MMNAADMSGANITDARDDLIDQVRLGTMAPDRAEAAAADLGLRPLTRSADLDPTREPDWSLTMAITWIVTRDANAVRRAWPKWCDATVEWTPILKKPGGSALQSPRVRGLVGLEIANVARLASAPGDADPGMSVTMARAALKNAFYEGRLVARGYRHGDQIRSNIEAAAWDSLDLVEGHDRLLAVSAEYRDTLVKSNDVIRLWPSRHGAAEPLRPRGRPVGARKQTEDKMRSDIQSGRLSLKQLAAEKQESLASRYGADRGTVTKARANVISDFVEKSPSI